MSPKSTGVLFSVKGAEFARTYSELLKVSEKIDIDRRGLAYWAPGKGGARFTPLVAEAAVKFIQKVITEGDSEITGGFKPLSAKYSKWKESVGHNTFWFRTGSMAEAITYKVQAFSSKAEMGIITIDPDAQISRTGGSVAATKLFHWLEFGTGSMPARPLVGLALRKFSALHFPQIVKSVDIALSRWLKKIHSSNAYHKSTKVDSLESLASRNVESDFAKKSDEPAPGIALTVEEVKDFMRSLYE